MPAISCTKLSSTARPYSRVRDFGMKLHAVDFFRSIAHRGDVAALRGCQRAIPVRAGSRPNRHGTSTHAMYPERRRRAASRDRRPATSPDRTRHDRASRAPRRYRARAIACRNRCPRSATPIRRSLGPFPARPSVSVLSGPPERMSAAGLRNCSASHGVSYGTISQ